jgi:hypothetical protein
MDGVGYRTFGQAAGGDRQLNQPIDVVLARLP